jgi:hypothetical protein
MAERESFASVAVVSKTSTRRFIGAGIFAFLVSLSGRLEDRNCPHSTTARDRAWRVNLGLDQRAAIGVDPAAPTERPLPEPSPAGWP